ncbi:MAG: DUF3592 domain-containing protein, partial [Clostridia bacterium]|nr:DUF3592 domain-containing protein [Clostridia bacterium]
MKSKLSIIMPLILAGIFIVVGTVGIIMVAINHYNENAFFSNAETCTAKVTNINTYTTRSRTGTGRHRRYRTTTHYNAYVSYNVNGTDYSTEFKDVSSSVRVGDNMTIYYDPLNPNDARIKSYLPDSLVAYGLLSVLIIGGVVIVIVAIRQKRRMSQPQISTQSANNMNSTSATYNDYNKEPLYYTDNQNTYNDYGNNSDNFNSQQSSPFDTYGNNSYNDNSDNFNSQPPSPFDT